MDSDDFRVYRVGILSDIARLNGTLIKLQDIVTSIAIEVGQLKATEKVRASIWGSVGGAVGGSVAAAVTALLMQRMVP